MLGSLRDCRRRNFTQQLSHSPTSLPGSKEHSTCLDLARMLTLVHCQPAEVLFRRMVAIRFTLGYSVNSRIVLWLCSLCSINVRSHKFVATDVSSGTR
jgi:hypothetical protein